ncbi:hypothetical protein K474DRAFT_1769227 [Panus rudis PR-1116 ss-1]|nr:hypothetical protein K474DRAFT_1769227 [Panus rudis PR-1116 ss-1]
MSYPDAIYPALFESLSGCEIIPSDTQTIPDEMPSESKTSHDAVMTAVDQQDKLDQAICAPPGPESTIETVEKTEFKLKRCLVMHSSSKIIDASEPSAYTQLQTNTHTVGPSGVAEMPPRNTSDTQMSHSSSVFERDHIAASISMKAVDTYGDPVKSDTSSVTDHNVDESVPAGGFSCDAIPSLTTNLEQYEDRHGILHSESSSPAPQFSTSEHVSIISTQVPEQEQDTFYAPPIGLEPADLADAHYAANDLLAASMLESDANSSEIIHLNDQLSTVKKTINAQAAPGLRFDNPSADASHPLSSSASYPSIGINTSAFLLSSSIGPAAVEFLATIDSSAEPTTMNECDEDIALPDRSPLSHTSGQFPSPANFKDENVVPEHIASMDEAQEIAVHEQNEPQETHLHEQGNVEEDNYLPPSSPMPSSPIISSSPPRLFSSPPPYALSSPPSSPSKPNDASKDKPWSSLQNDLPADDVVSQSSVAQSAFPVDQQDSRSQPKLAKSDMLSYLPPNPKRPTMAHQKKQHKKLITPFRSPLISSDSPLMKGLGVYYRGQGIPRLDPMGEVMTSEDPSPQSAKDGTEAASAGSLGNKAQDYTKKAAKQFKSPLSQDSFAGLAPSSTASTRLEPLTYPGLSTQALQAKVQKLKQAIKIKQENNAKEDEALSALVSKWRSAGREVAWEVWEIVKDLEPNQMPRANGGGWDEDEKPFYGLGRKREPGGGWDDAGDSKRTRLDSSWGWDDQKAATSTEKLEDLEMQSVEDDDASRLEHTLGTMLRFMGIDPETLGWDEDEGDFVGEP